MTTTDHTTDVDDDARTDEILEVEALALEDVKLQDEAAAIAERREQIRARLLALHPGTGSIPAGPYKVTVRAGARRLDPAKVAEAYPVVQHPELYSPKPDTTKIRHHIAAADLEPFLIEGKPTVVIS